VGVLNSRRSVCDGYANLLTALLRAAGIPAKKVTGFALGMSTNGDWPASLNPGRDSNHAWTEAFVDGRWIIIDSTWNSGNDWEFGGVTASHGLWGYRYFDISQAFFSATHVIQDYNEHGINDFVRRSARTASVFPGNVRINNRQNLSIGLYNIDGSNYIRLRDAAAIYSMMNGYADIEWDNATSTISIIHGSPYQHVGGELTGAQSLRRATATLSTARVSLNGELVFMRAYTINSTTWFRLRDVATLIGFEVDFDNTTGTIFVESR